MNTIVKKEELQFEEEDAHVLGDDSPDEDQLELPKIAARQRKQVKRKGKKGKRKAGFKKKTGKKKKARKNKSKGFKVAKVERLGREKLPKLNIRQNDDVMVLDEPEDRKPSKPTGPPSGSKKATPPDILDTIMLGQEKVFGTPDPAKRAEKRKTPMSGHDRRNRHEPPPVQDVFFNPPRNHQPAPNPSHRPRPVPPPPLAEQAPPVAPIAAHDYGHAPTVNAHGQQHYHYYQNAQMQHGSAYGQQHYQPQMQEFHPNPRQNATVNAVLYPYYFQLPQSHFRAPPSGIYPLEEPPNQQADYPHPESCHFPTQQLYQTYFDYYYKKFPDAIPPPPPRDHPDYPGRRREAAQNAAGPSVEQNEPGPSNAVQEASGPSNESVAKTEPDSDENEEEEPRKKPRVGPKTPPGEGPETKIWEQWQALELRFVHHRPGDDDENQDDLIDYRHPNEPERRLTRTERETLKRVAVYGPGSDPNEKWSPSAFGLFCEYVAQTELYRYTPTTPYPTLKRLLKEVALAAFNHKLNNHQIRMQLYSGFRYYAHGMDRGGLYPFEIAFSVPPQTPELYMDNGYIRTREELAAPQIPLPPPSPVSSSVLSQEEEHKKIQSLGQPSTSAEVPVEEKIVKKELDGSKGVLVEGLLESLKNELKVELKKEVEQDFEEKQRKKKEEREERRRLRKEKEKKGPKGEKDEKEKTVVVEEFSTFGGSRVSPVSVHNSHSSSGSGKSASGPTSPKSSSSSSSSSSDSEDDEKKLPKRYQAPLKRASRSKSSERAPSRRSERRSDHRSEQRSQPGTASRRRPSRSKSPPILRRQRERRLINPHNLSPPRPISRSGVQSSNFVAFGQMGQAYGSKYMGDERNREVQMHIERAKLAAREREEREGFIRNHFERKHRGRGGRGRGSHSNGPGRNSPVWPLQKKSRSRSRTPRHGSRSHPRKSPSTHRRPTSPSPKKSPGKHIAPAERAASSTIARFQDHRDPRPDRPSINDRIAWNIEDRPDRIRNADGR